MTRAEAVVRVVDEPGPTEAVAGGFAPTTTPGPTGAVRYLPLMLPLSLFAMSVAQLLWSLTWIPEGWTFGERTAQEHWLRVAVIRGLLAGMTYLCVRRSRDRQWWWAAWAVAAASLLVTVIGR